MPRPFFIFHTFSYVQYILRQSLPICWSFVLIVHEPFFIFSLHLPICWSFVLTVQEPFFIFSLHLPICWSFVLTVHEPFFIFNLYLPICRSFVFIGIIQAFLLLDQARTSFYIRYYRVYIIHFKTFIYQPFGSLLMKQYCIIICYQ